MTLTPAACANGSIRSIPLLGNGQRVGGIPQDRDADLAEADVVHLREERRQVALRPVVDDADRELGRGGARECEGGAGRGEEGGNDLHVAVHWRPRTGATPKRGEPATWWSAWPRGTAGRARWSFAAGSSWPPAARRRRTSPGRAGGRRSARAASCTPSPTRSRVGRRGFAQALESGPCDRRVGGSDERCRRGIGRLRRP